MIKSTRLEDSGRWSRGQAAIYGLLFGPVLLLILDGMEGNEIMKEFISLPWYLVIPAAVAFVLCGPAAFALGAIIHNWLVVGTADPGP